MAKKTNRKGKVLRRAKVTPVAVETVRRAKLAAEESPARLRQAVTAGTREQKIALLKKIGILDASGRIAKRVTNWGPGPSHTSVFESFDD